MVYSAANMKDMQRLEVPGLSSQKISHQPPFSVPSGRTYGPRVRPSVSLILPEDAPWRHISSKLTQHSLDPRNAMPNLRSEWEGSLG